MNFVPNDPRLYLYHVSAAGALTCQVIADPNWDGNFYSGTLIRLSSVGVSLTPTCIVAWNRYRGPVMSERFDSAGGSVWGAPLRRSGTSQGSSAGRCRDGRRWWPVLFSVGGAGLTRELRVAAVDSSGGLTGPANGSAIASASNLGPFQAVAVAGGACLFWQEVGNVAAPLSPPRKRQRRAHGQRLLSCEPGAPVARLRIRPSRGGRRLGRILCGVRRGTLQVSPFAAGSKRRHRFGSNWNLALDEAYSMNSDGRVRRARGRVSSNKQLSVCHFNRQCIDVWSGAQAHVLHTIDTSALHWGPRCTGLRRPTSSGGAILVDMNAVVCSPFSTRACLCNVWTRRGRIGS